MFTSCDIAEHSNILNMKKTENLKEAQTPKKIEKLNEKDLKQVKGGFVVDEDLIGF